MTRLTSFFLLFSDSWFCFCRIENRKGGEREVRFHTCHVHSLLQLKSHMLQVSSTRPTDAYVECSVACPARLSNI